MPSFPSSPTPNQEYTESGVTYTFTGSKWKKVVLSNSFRGESVTTSNSSINFDLSRGNFFDMNYSSNTTVAFSTPPPATQSQRFDILVNTPDSEGFSLSNASYDNLLTPSYLTAPVGLFFKPDGRELYTLDNTGVVLQRSMSTPWRIDTVSLSARVLGVSGQESSAQAFSFDATGTLMFVVGFTNDTVYRYSLTIPWDISSAAYSSQSFSVAAQEATPTGISFKPDGTKMYVNGVASDAIFQYNLPTPWSLTGAAYENKFLVVSAQDGTPRGHQFDPTGTLVFVAGGTTSQVYRYNLSTPWDVSTGVYSGVFFSVASQDTIPCGVHFKPEGDKMYIMGVATKGIYQYSTVATSATVTWPTTVAWQDGSAPVLTPGKSHLLEFYTSNGGASYYASPAERDISL